LLASPPDSSLPQLPLIVRHNPLIVDSHQLDHLIDIFRRIDAAGGRALLAGKDGVGSDAALLPERRPDGLGEAEVGGALTVQVTDLLPAHAETQLAPAAGRDLHARPAPHLLDDLLARASRLRHGSLLSSRLEVETVPQCEDAVGA